MSTIALPSGHVTSRVLVPKPIAETLIANVSPGSHVLTAGFASAFPFIVIVALCGVTRTVICDGDFGAGAGGALVVGGAVGVAATGGGGGARRVTTATVTATVVTPTSKRTSGTSQRAARVFGGAMAAPGGVPRLTSLYAAAVAVDRRSRSPPDL